MENLEMSLFGSDSDLELNLDAVPDLVMLKSLLPICILPLHQNSKNTEYYLR